MIWRFVDAVNAVSLSLLGGYRFADLVTHPSLETHEVFFGGRLDGYPPMADNRKVEPIETSTFTSQITALLSDEEYGRFSPAKVVKQEFRDETEDV